MSNNKNSEFGATTWKEENNTGGPKGNNFNQDREELPRIPFMRLKEGSNYLRLVTMPYKYWYIKYQGPQVRIPYGVNVQCSTPLYEDDPATGMGYPKKKKYYVAVLDRAEMKKDVDDETREPLKILDMSTVIYNDLKAECDTLNEMDSEQGIEGSDHSPTEFDINVRYKKGAGPADTYKVIRAANDPLSSNDLAVIEAIGGMEVVEKILLRHATPPHPKAVIKRLQKHGWVEGEKAPDEVLEKIAKAKEKTNGKAADSGEEKAETKAEVSGDNLKATKDDDYSFPDKPNKTSEASEEAQA